MCVNFLPSLMDFADVRLDLCAESVFDVTVPNNTALGAGGTM